MTAAYAVSTSPAARSRRRVLLAAAAVAAVALGTTAVVHRSDRTPAPLGGQTISAGTTVRVPAGRTATDADMRAETRRHLASVIALAPLPPGAVGRSTPPALLLAAGASSTGSPNELVTTQYDFSAGLSMSEAIDYASAHQPVGWTAEGSGDTGGPGGVTTRFVSFARDDSTDAYGPSQLVVSVAPAVGGVGIRTDAMASWRPAPNPAVTIDPVSVTGARLVLTRPPAPAITTASMVNQVRTTALSAVEARRVVEVVNAQRPAIPSGPRGCPAILGSSTDVLTLHTGDGDVVISIRTACPTGVTISRAGRELAPEPDGWAAIDAVVQQVARGHVMATSTSTGS